MNRADAFELVRGRLGETATLAHCLACEACMRQLAEHLGEDPDLWGLAGLVHDVDLDVCQNDPARHGLVGAEVLAQRGAPAPVIQAVLGHAEKGPRTTLLDKALWVVDPTTGFITAAALIRPSKSTSDLTVRSIRKRMKDKRFSAAVSREQMAACEPLLGLDLDTFLGLCLKAMDGIRDQLGLAGSAPAA